PEFLKQQQKLLAERDEIAKSGEPILTAKIRLPSGEILDRVDSSFQLQEYQKNDDGSMSSGVTGRSGGRLQWHRRAINEGTTTFTLFLPKEGLRSKPVIVKVKNGKASPNFIIFEMGRN